MKILTFLLLFNTFFISSANSSVFPRFACLRTKTVKLHVGPGANFPVSWIFVRPLLPVEILAEFDIWRLIRDYQGTEGWVHKTALSGRRSFISLHQVQALKKSPDEHAQNLAFVEPEVTGRILECQAKWCRVEIKEVIENGSGKVFTGWLPRQNMWGLYPHESKFK